MKTRYLTKTGIIAALYVVLTVFSGLFGLSNGLIQFRLSEALTVLPVFTQTAVPGLFIGCLISNILLGGTAFDLVFGSLATLLGAILTRSLRKFKILPLLSPVITNTIIIPFVLVYGIGIRLPIWLAALYIFTGEFVTAGIIGGLLRITVFKNNHLKRIIGDD